MRNTHVTLDNLCLKRHNKLQQVGYQSEAAFSRVFKQWTGQAPAAYRRVAAASA